MMCVREDTPRPGDRRGATFGAALAAAAARLQQAGIETARLDAELLLAHASGASRSALLAAQRDPLPSQVAREFNAIVRRRLGREPVAYIVGSREFWSLDFEVTPAVLIPRPETELMIETAAALLRDLPGPRIADIGTGSGCIAVALAHELPSARVLATDVSSAALAVARRNASRLGVGERVRFLAGDLFAPLASAAGVRFDAICSNPPYVAAAEVAALAPELGYEPERALVAGDGLAVIRRLLQEAPRWLVPGGRLLIEIGHGQASAVRALAAAAGFARAEIRADYAGVPRLLIAGR